MTTPQFVEYEVALLLAKYGRDAVLTALAQKLRLSAADLEEGLKDLPIPSVTRRRKAKAVRADPLGEITSRHPEKARQLRALRSRFENRIFLPELRDVRRFFEEHSQRLGNIKSRAESLAKLLQLLAVLEPDELDALCRTGESEQYSSLGVISDEILRRDR